MYFVVVSTFLSNIPNGYVGASCPNFKAHIPLQGYHDLQFPDVPDIWLRFVPIHAYVSPTQRYGRPRTIYPPSN